MQITRRNICPWPKDLPVASEWVVLRFVFLLFHLSASQTFGHLLATRVAANYKQQQQQQHQYIAQLKWATTSETHHLVSILSASLSHSLLNKLTTKQGGTHLRRADAFALEWEIRIHVSFARTSRLTWLTFGPTTETTTTTETETMMMTPERKIFNCRAIFQLLHFFCSQQQQPRLSLHPPSEWLPS